MLGAGMGWDGELLFLHSALPGHTVGALPCVF